MNINELIKKYTYLVDRVVNTIKESTLEKEDLRQEGLIALWKAIVNYDRQKNDNFEAYAVIIIRNKIYSKLKYENRPKRKPPVECADIWGKVGETELLLEEVIGDNDVLIDKEKIKDLDMDFVKVCIKKDKIKDVQAETGLSRRALHKKMVEEKRKLKESIIE